VVTLGSGCASIAYADQESRKPSEALDHTIKELHDLSTSWHILFRRVTNLEAHLTFLQDALSEYCDALADHQGTNRTIQSVKEANESVRYLQSSCLSLRLLVSDYRERTWTQINLVMYLFFTGLSKVLTGEEQLYHLANQAESRANKEIAVQSNKVAGFTAMIAEQTQRDSASMITIAAVTMFFLPGTFIAVR